MTPPYSPASIKKWPFSMAVCLFAMLLGGSSPERLATVPLSRMDLPWWRDRFAGKQAELRRERVDLVWYGDSITQFWERAGPEPWRDYVPVWQHFYGDRHAINLGFVGDSTSHLLWRIENGEAAGIHPRAAVVLIGANNFGRAHWGAAATQAGIETVIATLRARLPGTNILLLGVLPSIRSPWVDQNTMTLNKALAARYAGGREATFIDVTALFLRNGHVDPAQFVDPRLNPPEPALHPTAQAAEAIAEAIEPTISTMLKDRNKVMGRKTLANSANRR